MSSSRLYSLDSSTSLYVKNYGSFTEYPTLIFLHSWGGSSLLFSQTIAKLPGHHCVSIDFRGWGQSTGPHDPRAYTIRELADDIERLLPLLDIDIKSFILVGHSMGGKVAQLLAGRNVFGAHLRGVILLAPAPPTPWKLPEELRAQGRNAFNNPETAEFVVRNILTSNPLDDKTIAMVVDSVMNGNKWATEAWTTYGIDEGILDEAKRIDVPVLVVAGGKDKLKSVEKLKNELLAHVEAELVVVDGGHLLPIEAPTAVAKHIEEFTNRFYDNE